MAVANYQYSQPHHTTSNVSLVLCLCQTDKEGQWLECSFCKQWFHLECIGITSYEYEWFSDSKLDVKYRCIHCQIHVLNPAITKTVFSDTGVLCNNSLSANKTTNQATVKYQPNVSTVVSVSEPQEVGDVPAKNCQCIVSTEVDEDIPIPLDISLDSLLKISINKNSEAISDEEHIVILDGIQTPKLYKNSSIILKEINRINSTC